MKTIEDLSRMTFDLLQVTLEELLTERVKVSILYNRIIVQINRVLSAQKELVRKERSE